MYCKKCGQQLPENAKFCASCGTLQDDEPVNEAVEETKPLPEEEPKAEFEDQPAAPSSDGSAPVKAKKGKKKLAIIIPIVAILLVGAITAALFLGPLKGMFIKNFQSSEKYVQYVEEKYVADGIEGPISMFDGIMQNASKDRTYSAKLEISEEIRTLLSSRIGTDISWLDNMTFSISQAFVDGNKTFRIIVSLNETKLFSIDCILDKETRCIYCGIPELSDKYISIDIGSIIEKAFDTVDSYSYGLGESMSRSFMSKYAEIYMSVLFSDDFYGEILPEADEIGDLIKKYVSVVLNCLTDTEKSSGSVTIGGVSEDCTILTTKITDQTVYDIAKSVLEEARDDSDIKKIIKDVMGSDIIDLYREITDIPSFDEIYEEYQKSVNEALEDVEESKSGSDFVADRVRALLVEYVNDSHEVIARAVLDADGNEVVKFGKVTSGNNVTYALSIYGVTYIYGTGTKNGDKESGILTLYGDEDMPVLNIEFTDFDMAAFKNGELRGTFVLTLSGSMLRQLPSEVMSILTSMKLKFEINMTKSSFYLRFSPVVNGSEYFSLTIESKPGAENKPGMPSRSNLMVIDKYSLNSYDEILSDWSKALNVDYLIEKLEEAGVPSQLLTFLNLYSG